MKLFNTLDMDAVRTSWKQKDNYDLSYYAARSLRLLLLCRDR